MDTTIIENINRNLIESLDKSTDEIDRILDMIGNLGFEKTEHKPDLYRKTQKVKIIRNGRGKRIAAIESLIKV